MFGRFTLSEIEIGMGLMALVTFGVFRLSQQLFYSRVGVRPEEVGLDIVKTLSNAIPTAIVFAVGLGVTLSIIERSRGMLLFAAGLFLVYVVVVVPIAAFLSGGAIKDGRGVAPSFGELDWGIGLRADPVKSVAVKSGSSFPPLNMTEDLLYLGSADATTILYSAARDELIRIPSSEIALVLGEEDRTSRGFQVVDRAVGLLIGVGFVLIPVMIAYGMWRGRGKANRTQADG
ncbi:MAG: hypothetical protein ACRD12_05820 [Acidimicrobiales bacterium]